MEGNIKLYKFIFNQPFSENKQHKYTLNGYMKLIILYKTKRYNSTHTLLFKKLSPCMVKTFLTHSVPTHING